MHTKCHLLTLYNRKFHSFLYFFYLLEKMNVYIMKFLTFHSLI